MISRPELGKRNKHVIIITPEIFGWPHIVEAKMKSVSTVDVGGAFGVHDLELVVLNSWC